MKKSSTASLDEWLHTTTTTATTLFTPSSSSSSKKIPLMMMSSSNSKNNNNNNNNTNNNNNNAIRIFVSSTFSDMTKERDLIATRVAPRVSQFGESIGVSVAVSDLRWGITAEQAKDTVAVCLDEVQKSDIVLIFCGHRYGWHVCNNELHFAKSVSSVSPSSSASKSKQQQQQDDFEKNNELLLHSIKQAAEMFGSSTIPWLRQLMLTKHHNHNQHHHDLSLSSCSLTSSEQSSAAMFLRKSSVTELEVRTALLKDKVDLRNIHVFLRSSGGTTSNSVQQQQQQNQKDALLLLSSSPTKVNSQIEECPEARLRLEKMKDALASLPSAKRYRNLNSSSATNNNSKDKEGKIMTTSTTTPEMKDSDDSVAVSSLPLLKSSVELEECIVAAVCESILNIFPERRNMQKPRKWERESQIQQVLANRSQIGFCVSF